MRVSDFHYHLPEELIAQEPASLRDGSRLLVLNRAQPEIAHRRFPDLIDYFTPGDVLVVNDSRVIPARLWGTKTPGGGQIEVLLSEEVAINDWWVMLRPGKRVRPGTQIQFTAHDSTASDLRAEVVEKNEEGLCRLRFQNTPDVKANLAEHGEVPLPPYISRERGQDLAADSQRYQTVYAQPPGSVAAPTAGLHFTNRMLDHLRQQCGVRVCHLTLHVGLGTFAPVKSETVEEHPMHAERYDLSESTVQAIAETRARGGKVWAVGTTSVRVLEHVAAQNSGRLVAGSGLTRLFVYPPYTFHVVDRLLTNFHLPESTLLMLVSAFISPGDTLGRDRLLAAYAEAVQHRYRFFSYGDAMLIL